MNTVGIDIDENLDASRLQGLKKLLQEFPHVLGVAVSDKEPHEVVVDDEDQQNMPVKLINVLRETGFHPDMLSA